jgi:hypothetical protein
MPGVIRPLLRWSTRAAPAGEAAPLRAVGKSDAP